MINKFTNKHVKHTLFGVLFFFIIGCSGTSEKMQEEPVVSINFQETVSNSDRLLIKSGVHVAEKMLEDYGANEKLNLYISADDADYQLQIKTHASVWYLLSEEILTSRGFYDYHSNSIFLNLNKIDLNLKRMEHYTEDRHKFMVTFVLLHEFFHPIQVSLSNGWSIAQDIYKEAFADIMADQYLSFATCKPVHTTYSGEIKFKFRHCSPEKLKPLIRFNIGRSILASMQDEVRLSNKKLELWIYDNASHPLFKDFYENMRKYANEKFFKDICKNFNLLEKSEVFECQIAFLKHSPEFEVNGIKQENKKILEALEKRTFLNYIDNRQINEKVITKHFSLEIDNIIKSTCKNKGKVCNAANDNLTNYKKFN